MTLKPWIRGGKGLLDADDQPILCSTYPCGPCCELIKAGELNTLLWNVVYYDGTGVQHDDAPIPGKDGHDYLCLYGEDHVNWDASVLDGTLTWHPKSFDAPGDPNAATDSGVGPAPCYAFWMDKYPTPYVRASCTYTMTSSGGDPFYHDMYIIIPKLVSWEQPITPGDPGSGYKKMWAIEKALVVAVRSDGSGLVGVGTMDLTQIMGLNEDESAICVRNKPFEGDSETVLPFFQVDAGGSASNLFDYPSVGSIGYFDNTAPIKLTLAITQDNWITVQVNDDHGFSIDLMDGNDTWQEYFADFLDATGFHLDSAFVPDGSINMAVEGYSMALADSGAIDATFSNGIFTMHPTPDLVMTSLDDYQVVFSDIELSRIEQIDVSCDPVDLICEYCEDRGYADTASLTLPTWALNTGDGDCSDAGYPSGTFILERDYDVPDAYIKHYSLLDFSVTKNYNLTGPGPDPEHHPTCFDAGYDPILDIQGSSVGSGGVLGGLTRCRWGHIFDEGEYVTANGVEMDSLQLMLFQVAYQYILPDWLGTRRTCWDGTAWEDIPELTFEFVDGGRHWYSMPNPLLMGWRLNARGAGDCESSNLIACGYAKVGTIGKAWYYRDDALDPNADDGTGHPNGVLSNALPPADVRNAESEIDCSTLSGISMASIKCSGWPAPVGKCNMRHWTEHLDFTIEDHACRTGLTWQSFVTGSIG